MMYINILLVLSVLFVTGRAQKDDPYFTGAWRTSLDGADSCWKQSTTECNRAMVVVHGGDWDITQGVPYDSSGAFERGWQNGADMVKGDFRVCKENIGVIMHSSPIEYYESIECRGKIVDDMTVEQCEACPMATTSFNFTSVPEMLSWSNDKVNFMFCLKQDDKLPRAISSMLEYNAQHRSIIEVKLPHLVDMYNSNPRPEGWDSVYYIAELTCPEDAASLLAMPQELLDRTFLVEFEDWDSKWPDPADLTNTLNAFKARGARTMAATNNNAIEATNANHQAIFDAGFDVVYTYNLANAVEVRKNVNTKRGISPP